MATEVTETCWLRIIICEYLEMCICCWFMACAQRTAMERIKYSGTNAEFLRLK